MPRWAFDQNQTEGAAYYTNVSGVHAHSTTPVPALEEVDPSRLVGSIPVDHLTCDFQPIVNLHTGENLGYEVLPRCLGEGLGSHAELFARATIEKRAGELGRALRTIAMREASGVALYMPVHPGELKDSYLVRPDDPIFGHEAPVFVQLMQPALSTLGQQIVRELRNRSSIGLVIEGFGAGPATLKQIVDLQPSALKLDRELLSGIDSNRRKQAVVRALVTMCHELGCQLIASGVDCEAELTAAIECGVMYAQGFVLGEAAPAV